MSTTTVQPLQKHIGTVKALDHRVIQFIASHERVDGDGEVILIDGIDLTRYRANPVVCLLHDHRQPVARTVSLMRQTIGGLPALVGTAQFPEGDAEAEAAYKKVKAGLLSAVSVGFISYKQGAPMFPNQSGPTHLKTELLEISIVSIPSCPTCLITSKSQKDDFIDIDEHQLQQALRDVLFRCVDQQVEAAVERQINLMRGRVD